MRKIILFILLFTSFSYSNEIDFKAFGTVGAVYNDNENYTFRKSPLQKKGSSDDISFNEDSLLGVQLSSDFSEHISILTQGIVQQDYQGENRFKIDWAYLKYYTNENLMFKLGRIRTPYYKNSDNLNIGYSNLMIREPIEVYGQVPFSAYNGVELTYSGLLSDYFYELQANYGQESFVAPIHSMNEEVDIDLKNLYALNFTIGTNEVQLRTTYLNADITATNTTLDTLFSSLKQSGFTSLASQYELKDKNSQYFALGLFIEYQNFIFNSEYGQRKVPSFYGDISGYYITLAYNFNDVVPYITYAKSKMEQELNINSVSSDLNNLMKIQNVSQKTVTVGMKYYINENFDVKLQYDHITPKGKYGGSYVNNLDEPENLDVISLAVDFTY